MSNADNLIARDANARVDVFVHDLDSGETRSVSVASDGAQAHSLSILPSISANGRFVAFQSEASNLTPEDDNHRGDIFIHDLDTSETQRNLGGQ